MRFLLSLVFVTGVLFFTSCDRAQQSARDSADQTSNSGTSQPQAKTTGGAETKTGQLQDKLTDVKARYESKPEEPSLTGADKADGSQQAFDRKIIRNAELDMEMKSPAAAASKIGSIVESSGGFVVTSESTRKAGSDPSNPDITVKLVARVPSGQFESVIRSLHGIDGKIKDEKT
jgi:hypothetical protein